MRRKDRKEMKKEVDVIIIGADVCSLITANLLSKKGYRVAIVDNAIGLGGNQLYIPVSLKLVHSLGLNLNNPLIIRRTIDKLTMYFNFGKNSIHSYLHFRIAILDVLNLCEFFAEYMEGLFYLWSEAQIIKQTVDNVHVIVKFPFGIEEISSRLLIKNSPPSGDYTLLISTGCVKNSEISDSLIIDYSGINLYLNLGRFVTGILTSPKNTFSNLISTIKIPWGPSKFLSKSPVMRFGLSAGHAVPPWIGDYLMNSAILAYKIASSRLEDKDDESVLREYLNFLSLIDMCKTLYHHALNGKIDELPASFVSEALRPPREVVI